MSGWATDSPLLSYPVTCLPLVVRTGLKVQQCAQYQFQLNGPCCCGVNTEMM